MGGCSAIAAPILGGRRRRGKKTMKGGNFYGPGGAITAGAMQWDAVANNGARPDGTILAGDADLVAPKLGGRRRRRTGKKVTRKGGRKTRKVGRKGRKTMRGGSSFGQVGYGFDGTGVGGMATAAGYNANVGRAPTGPDGVVPLH